MKDRKKIRFIKVAVVFMIALGVSINAHALSPFEDDYELKLLGKFVFFDNISNPRVQSCSSCHDPRTGGTGINSFINLTQVAENGADPGAVGSLKPPTNAYATLIPSFHSGPESGCRGPASSCGGNFWNGRSVGFDGDLFPNSTFDIDIDIIPESLSRYDKYLGPVADQALNPFSNDVEQNVPDGIDDGLAGAEFVCRHVKKSRYGFLYDLAWGEPIMCDEEHVAASFQRIGVALSAYQGSSEINSFSSRRDLALRAELACACKEGESSVHYPGDDVCSEVGSSCLPFIRRNPDYKNSPGKFPLVGFTEEENWGHDLFYGLQSDLNPGPQPKDAQCTECHVTRRDLGFNVDYDGDGELDMAPPGPGGPPGSPPPSPQLVVKFDGTGLNERYTDDSYHTIGTPYNLEIANPELVPNPDYDPEDPRSVEFFAGLAGHTLNSRHNGLRKVPTLRNADKRPHRRFVKAYGANGWFKSLESIIHFYNTSLIGNCDIETDDNSCTDRREIAIQNTTAWTMYGITRCEEREEGWTESEALKANCWPAPEFFGAPPQFVGNLFLTPEEEAALVAYMKTFTDLKTATRPNSIELFFAILKNRKISKHKR